MAESDYFPQPEFPEDAELINKREELRGMLARAFDNYRDNDIAVQKNPNLEPNIAHDTYVEDVRNIQKSDPTTFQIIQDENTDAEIERLNKLQLGEKSVFGGFDEYLKDVARMRGQVMLGRENEETISPGVRGQAMITGDDAPFYVGGKTPVDTSYHEALHSVAHVDIGDAMAFVDKRSGEVIPPETMARSFDYLRATINGDEESAKEDYSFAKKIYRGEAEMSGSTLISFALSTMNDMFSYGMIPEEYTGNPKVQEALDYFDKEGQGVLSSLIGTEPEQVKKVKAEMVREEGNEGLKHLSTLMEIADNFVFSNFTDVEVDLDRTGFESTIK